MVCKQTIAGLWHHAVFAAQLGHRHAAFSLAQDRKDLRLCVSACLHSKSPRSYCRENSTYAPPYFQGGLPLRFVQQSRENPELPISPTIIQLRREKFIGSDDAAV